MRMARCSYAFAARSGLRARDLLVLEVSRRTDVQADARRSVYTGYGRQLLLQTDPVNEL